MKTFSNKERLEFAKTHKGTHAWMREVDNKGNCIAVDFVEPENFSIGWNNTIGSDGFGYAREEDGTLVKIPHAGNVVIEENVEIGSNTCIDRAVVGSTVIGAGTKIDNLVHIAHGVKIGKNCLIAAGAVIGGSCEIGDNCNIWVHASIKNKVKIGSNCIIGAGAVVLTDVPDNSVFVGNPAKFLRENK